MQPLLYNDLSTWYRLVDPYSDHAGEAAAYGAALERGATFRPETLLELGAGAGHNAMYLKGRFRCTLTDLSPQMQALSQELHPECEHLPGDMRSLRLDRTFDAVLVADAIMYMTTAQDLKAAVQTAFVHTKPDGAAVFAPDFVAERFVERTNILSENAGDRALRGLEWLWDPNPADNIFTADYFFALRDGKEMKTIHDRHIEGLFPRAQWLAILSEAGFEVETVRRTFDDDMTDEIFLGRRPSG